MSDTEQQPEAPAGYENYDMQVPAEYLRSRETPEALGMDGSKLVELLREERTREATQNPTPEQLAARHINVVSDLEAREGGTARCAVCGMFPGPGEMLIPDQNAIQRLYCLDHAPASSRRMAALVEVVEPAVCPTCERPLTLP